MLFMIALKDASHDVVVTDNHLVSFVRDEKVRQQIANYLEDKTS